jgi:uncharacterized paraquat-inducible protein A
MRPSIRFRCPSCSARIKAPSQLLGQKRICPKCGSEITVQPEAPEDLGPMLLLDDSKPPARRRRRLTGVY